MTPWLIRTKDFFAYLLSRSWRKPYLMFGQRVMVVGIASPQQRGRRHHNDNLGDENDQ